MSGASTRSALPGWARPDSHAPLGTDPRPICRSQSPVGTRISPRSPTIPTRRPFSSEARDGQDGGRHLLEPAADLIEPVHAALGAAPGRQPGDARGASPRRGLRIGGSLRVRHRLRVAITNTDADDFTKNLSTVRVEIRYALVVEVPSAFAVVTGL